MTSRDHRSKHRRLGLLEGDGTARGTLADRLGRPVLSPPLLAAASLREALA